MQKVLGENNADGTTLITINRPERRNAICAETALMLQKAFQDFERSSTQRAAVLTGAGNEAFSGGADTGNFPELWRCIPTVGFETTKPIVSAVAGWCCRRRSGALDDVRSHGGCGERQVFLSRSAIGFYRRPDCRTGGANSAQGCDGNDAVVPHPRSATRLHHRPRQRGCADRTAGPGCAEDGTRADRVLAAGAEDVDALCNGG